MNHPFADLYARIPSVTCKGLCGHPHDGCCGPIACTATEAAILDGYDGVASPWLALGDGVVHMDMDRLGIGWNCPHLTLDGRCGAYEVRPLVCRLWGAIHALACSWGCQPTRYMTNHEVTALFREVDKRQVETAKKILV